MNERMYLVFGPELEPQVHLLSEHAEHLFRQREEVSSGSDKARAQAYEQSFSKGARYAIPCWSNDALTIVANYYQGPHKDEIQRIAACIVTGVPYSKYGEGGDDGAGVRLVPTRPIKPPAGQRVPLAAVRSS